MTGSRFIAVMLIALLVASCGGSGPRRVVTSHEGGVPVATAAQNTEYTLGSGDRIRLTVYGESDLSGEFEVSGAGTVSLPLIGDVAAQGLTLQQLQQSIVARLRDGYLVDPRVSIDVLNYRPFYTVGEISQPGSHPYVNGLNVISAIAISGGYTYRADQGRVFITRAGASEELEFPTAQNIRVLPGDVIRVPERFF